jgi:poly(3-hydroxybutyrate) depolymerase
MFSLLFAALLASAPPAADCHVGAYRLADGQSLDIAPSDEGRLRWRRIDGASGQLRREHDDSWKSTFGWTDRPDGKEVVFTDCTKGDLTFGGMAAKRIPLEVHDTVFTGDGGTRLAGRLILPPGSGKVPIVVLVHGAEHNSARCGRVRL